MGNVKNFYFRDMKTYGILLLFFLTVFSGCRRSERGDNETLSPLPRNNVFRVSGIINQDEVWSADKKYLLQGLVRVAEGVTLTIEAGTVVLGDFKTQGGLLVEQGGRLFVSGTRENPVVFTSSQPVGERKHGDWQGIILLGKAPVNKTNAFLPQISNSAYGGTFPYDNSGKLNYLRIEFAGSNELGGLTLAGVGKGTTIRNVQVSRSSGKGFYVAGGTCYAKNLIAHNCLQEGFFFTEGHTGKFQFGIITNTNTALASVNGFLQSSSNSPVTRSVISNFTFLGSNKGTGIKISNNSHTSIFNSVIVKFTTGIILEGIETANAFYAGEAVCRGNVLADCSSDFSVISAVNAGNVLQLLQGQNSSLASSSGLFQDVFLYNFIPVETFLQNGADFSSPFLADLTQVSFLGAMISDWTEPWSNWSPDTTDY